ncbi:ribosome recycling factor [Rubritalea squalenifaciens DSM 18772]|uniref:Ribosome-recycling factor n=1 Tax=Rubritalea squalenifaciens DSM 18772 TaxID=1123071 RepID=A0A1M6IKH8_9BACT|nr:ribosome recycling factor [Rubritalea squalenifaciens]SHJ34919.1 ribosome recycling factor [Rubritalea squalenifaciens DSM 18772]
MEPQEVLEELEMSMEQAVEYMGSEFASVRTGKASPALVDGVVVEVKAYGSKMKLRELAVITTPEPRQILIQPYDASTINDIDRAIREAQLGFNPVNEGKTLRLPIPELTEERRQQMVKRVRTISEDTKVRIRGCRKEGMDSGKKMKNDNVLTEDSLRDFEASVQELTDKFVKQIDEETAAKEKEVMTV